jgi:ATP-binding cassette subfamily B multidrug efflux pump
MVTSTPASRSICGRREVAVGTVAMALPLAWQIVNMAGWVAYQITDIFENIGVVQEGMSAIASRSACRQAGCQGARGHARRDPFEDIRFGYGSEKG